MPQHPFQVCVAGSSRFFKCSFWLGVRCLTPDAVARASAGLVDENVGAVGLWAMLVHLAFDLHVSFRLHVAEAIQHAAPLHFTPAERKKLDSFSGSFAKWRWQTLVTATAALRNLSFLRTPARMEHLDVICAHAVDQAEWRGARFAITSAIFWRRMEGIDALGWEVGRGIE